MAVHTPVTMTVPIPTTNTVPISATMNVPIRASPDPSLGPSDPLDNTTTTSAREEQESRQEFSYHITKKLFITAYIVILLTELVESFSTESSVGLNSYASSEFNAHSMISTAVLAYKIVAVCAYPILGKVADLLGRGEGFAVVVLFYVVCYVLFASCQNIATFIVGYAFFAVGRIGFRTFVYIFIADSTNLQNRAMLTQLPEALASVAAMYAGSYVQDAFLKHSTWRWGYGAWSIILGVTFVPLTAVMFYCDRVMKKNGGRKKALIMSDLPEGSWWTKAKHVMLTEMDIIGGGLLMAGTALFFVPFTITGTTDPEGWSDASTIVMLVVGFVLLLVFVLWCHFFDRLPLSQDRLPFIPLKGFRNRNVLIAFSMVVLDAIENAGFNVYFLTTLQVGGYYTAGQAVRIDDAKKVSIELGGVIVGVFMKYSKQTRLWVWVGTPLLILGHGLTVWFFNRDGVMERTVLLYVMQMITGVGKAFYMTPLQVQVQALSGVEGIAMSTSFFLAFGAVGTLVGTAIAGGIWNNVVVNKLKHNLPSDMKSNATQIFQNINVALSYPEGSAARSAISLSYRETEQIIGWVCLGLIAPMIVLMLFVKELKLSEKHDAYEDTQDEYDADEVVEESVSEKDTPRTSS